MRWLENGNGIDGRHRYQFAACRPGGQQYQCGEAQRPAQSCLVDGSGMQRDQTPESLLIQVSVGRGWPLEKDIVVCSQSIDLSFVSLPSIIY
jgi:hypothetical protein